MALPRKLALATLWSAGAFALAFATFGAFGALAPRPPAPGNHVAVATVTERYDSGPQAAA
jgi:hypothetical protein